MRGKDLPRKIRLRSKSWAFLVTEARKEEGAE
jgi:hypothetical protein